MQKGFERNPNRSPKNWQDSLRLGKVLAAYPESKTVDITMVNGSGVHYKVPVLCPFASSASGTSYLPAPHNPKLKTEEGFDIPKAYDKRDVYAIIGFVEGIGTMPVVLGFKFPEVNQLSFPESAGANQKMERHEGDRYHRITGDTVTELGGKDVSGEEEIRYPDHSFFKVVKNGGSRDLTDLSQANRDAATIPFRLKKEDRKGFYFQHASGTRIFIGHDGEVKISHHAGTWISIGPSTDDLAAAEAPGSMIDSTTDPPSEADDSPAQVHVGHSSGTYLTIDTAGTVTIYSSDIKLGAGATRRPLLDSRTHTYLENFVQALNTWLNNHTHPETQAVTNVPVQTAALSGPPAIGDAASNHTTSS